MSIKARQVAAVTALVAVVVLGVTGLHLATLLRVSLEETALRADMLAFAIYQRAREVVPGAADPYGAVRTDAGLRSILESSIAYSPSVTYAAVVDTAGIAIAHSFPAREGQPLPPQADLRALQRRGLLDQIRAIYSDRTFEVRQPLLAGEREFGAIRIGVSTLLVRSDLHQALRQAGQTALAALFIAVMAATVFAQWMLRPIHVIRAGLTRLGRGESDVRLDLPAGEEFRELGDSFEALSAQLAAMRARQPVPSSEIETIVDRLEDAVALVNAQGELLFANPAMRALAPGLEPGRSVAAALPAEHAVRRALEQALLTQRPQGPAAAEIGDGPAAERLVTAYPVLDAARRLVGAMLVVRNVGYLDRVRSTLQYSRKLAALGRLLAGVAHEVKNPLNAMTIHLELLRGKLARVPAVVGAGDGPDEGRADVARHVEIIAGEIKRLDQVVQDFLRFTRPEELRLEPILLPALLKEVARVIGPEAERTGVTVRIDCPSPIEINGDAGMLRQALLNLAINACQAMPNGGVLRMACRSAPRGRVELVVSDTGVGIPPEHLGRIFDLYFTTKPDGSGIGLSMVYRTVHLHDGDIEVESTPGRGTTFRVLLPQG
ncbi:MAG TPA: ATP-binding protein [Vicinamibacterales bacterium]|nr:ATP-binding protein [Vicinamibacterales bacterium]